MSEVRQAMPYISFLRITKRITNKFVPNGQQNAAGQDLYQHVTDLPGIECEVVPYMGLVAGPSQRYRFLSKTFFEAELAKLVAKPSKTAEDNNAISNLQARLADAEVVWVEQVLAAASLPALSDLWVNVFSDALDTFAAWVEDADAPAGIPLYPLEMQWEAKVPYDAAKSIELKVGLYSDPAGLTQPTISTLSYEDAATLVNREMRNTQIADRIAQINSQLDELPAGASPQRTQLMQERAYVEAEQARQAATQVGVLSELVSNASIQASLPALMMAIFGTLKTKFWPDLDMAAVQSRLGPALSQIA